MSTNEIGGRPAPPTAPAPDGYPSGREVLRRFGGAELLVRPLKPTDAPALRDFFRSHTPETVYQRDFSVKKDLTREEAARLCTLDYVERMAFAAFVPGDEGGIVGIGRYDLDRGTGLVETALVVGESWRRRGIGGFLLDLLIDYARSRGYAGIVAYLLPTSRGMIAIHRRRGHLLSWDPGMRAYRMEHRFAAQAAPGPAAVG